jgi:hypothetical protein
MEFEQDAAGGGGRNCGMESWKEEDGLVLWCARQDRNSWGCRLGQPWGGPAWQRLVTGDDGETRSVGTTRF